MPARTRIAMAVGAGVVALVAGFEGLRQQPYLDTGNVPTVCYGYTHKVEPRWYSKAECEGLLLQELTVAASAVNRNLTRPVPQPTFDAMTSFVYNVGEGSFRKSTMLQKLNTGDVAGACKQLLRWVYVGPKDCRVASNNCQGIVIRRQAEHDLCMKGT